MGLYSWWLNSWVGDEEGELTIKNSDGSPWDGEPIPGLRADPLSADAIFCPNWTNVFVKNATQLTSSSRINCVLDSSIKNDSMHRNCKKYVGGGNGINGKMNKVQTLISEIETRKKSGKGYSSNIRHGSGRPSGWMLSLFFPFLSP